MRADVRSPRRRRPRNPLRRSLIVTHRWLSLVLGLVLLVITTSGAILLYTPEIQRWLNSDAYAASGGPTVVSFQQAADTVAARYPDLVPQAVIAEHGVLRVTDFTSSVTVDPATGAVLGEVHEMPSWWGWLENLHECGFTCDDYPGYIPALNAEVPGTGWLGFEDTPVTVGGLILGLAGLLLLFLAVSGLVLWWPKPSRWRTSMAVRWRKGRFARDTDLHKVVGMIALPLLLIWGFTGIGFEFGPVEQAWYAVTPGDEQEVEWPVAAESDTPDIGIDGAAAAAATAVPGGTVVAVLPPTADDPTTTYTVWLAAGIDTYEHSDFPGNVGVGVDPHTAETTVAYGAPDEAVAQTLWDSWSYPVHAGVVVNGWWRLVWFVLGVTPLVLAVTGVSTWLVRRGNKRRRKLARAGRGSAGETAPEAVPDDDVLDEALAPTGDVPTTAEPARTPIADGTAPSGPSTGLPPAAPA